MTDKDETEGAASAEAAAVERLSAVLKELVLRLSGGGAGRAPDDGQG